MRITQKTNKYISFFLVAVIILTSFAPFHQVEAAGIKIYNYNTDVTQTYTSTQVKYLCNGKAAEMDMPGIIINNIALASYDELFSNMLGQTCTYNKNTGAITISNQNNTISMKLGSKSAVVNGKTVTMSVAPVKLKFVEYGYEKIYVPTRFVAENLGFSYVWVSTSGTAKITRTLSLEIGLNNYDYNGVFYGIQYAQKDVELDNLPLFSYHGVVMVQVKAFEEAGCTISQNEESITISKGDIKLSMSFNQKAAYVNDKKFIMEEAAYHTKNTLTENVYTIVPLEFSAQMLGYDLSYEDSTKTYSLLATNRTGNAQLVDAITQYQGSTSSQGESETNSYANQFFEWDKQNSFDNLINQATNSIHSISTTSIVNGPISLYIYRNQKSEQDGSEIFQFAASDRITEVESFRTESGTIKVIIHNATSANYGTLSIGLPLVEKYTIDSNDIDKIVTIEFTLTKDKYLYSLSLLEEEQVLQVMVYPSFLTKVTGMSNQHSDAIMLYGLSKDDLHFVEDGGILTIDLPTTANCIGDQFFYDTNNMYLTYCLVNSISEGTRFTVQMSSDKKYYVNETEEYCSIHFTDINQEELDDGTLETSSIPSEINLPDDRLLIPVPDGITIAQVSDQDNYLDSNFIISIEGNHTEYYKQNKICNPYSVIENTTIYYNSTTNMTNISFDTKLICAYQYDISQGYLIVNVARPSELYSKIVVLDAGHGGIDPGATKSGIKEKDLNYIILNQYAKEYFASSDIKVYYTRLSDVKIDLYERADFAAEIGADLFLSLHMNANNSSSVTGTQVFYSTSNNKKNSAGLNSYLLAKTLVNNLSSSLNSKNRGATSSEFVVVKYNTVPAVLIELGFMTNANELKLLSSSSYQKKAAKTIYDTVVQIFNTYPTGR